MFVMHWFKMDNIKVTKRYVFFIIFYVETAPLMTTIGLIRRI